MYIRHTSDRQMDVRQHHRLMPPPRGGGITSINKVRVTGFKGTAGHTQSRVDCHHYAAPPLIGGSIRLCFCL